ncbi:hypothetical protein HY484_02815 [Candidatus Woesearchaeota archaeon]|nr:hypothetical protein [Candidatus Woesearchaeota archaeon]
MLFKNKKGLELPITAIIVLIIAITFLGLAVYFIKTLFTGGTEILSGEMAKIKGELRKNMEESGESFIFSVGDELEVSRGEPLKFYIGVRNTILSEKCYRIAMKCLKPFTPVGQGGRCGSSETDLLVGGIEQDGTPVQQNDNWFTKLLSEFTVPGNEVAVNPVTLQITSAQLDTYLMEANVYDGALSGGQCDFTQSTTPISKRFHIILK